MAISKSQLGPERDLYIEYDYEQVMFRWDSSSQKIFRRFYGCDEDLLPVDHTNKLFFDALNYGKEITRERYMEEISR